MPTGISWTDETWNPTTGCSHVSDGCRFCYAEALSLRVGWSHKPWTAPNAAENVRLHPKRLRKPYSWQEPKRVFVDSMSDLFHEQVPDSYIRQVWDVMLDTPQHIYQILTKRPERAARWAGPWPSHIWMGTSVEDERVQARIGILRQIPAAVRFLSCEPLLGPIDLRRDLGICLGCQSCLEWADETHTTVVQAPHVLVPRWLDWVIVGGESGRHLTAHPERRMDQAWARQIRDACQTAGIAFFFKQQSAIRSGQGAALEETDGTSWEWHQYPGHYSALRQVGSGGPETERTDPSPPEQLPLL